MLGEYFMTMAFVLLSVIIGSEQEVIETLRKIDSVKEAFRVYGVYDAIAKIETETMGELKEVVTYHVRRIDGVRSTLTMVCD